MPKSDLRSRIFSFFLTLSISSMLLAQPAPTTAPDETSDDHGPHARRAPDRGERRAVAPTTAAAGDQISVTEGQVQLASGILHYRATAGTMILKDESEKP